MVRVAVLVLERELRETLRDPHVLAFFVFPLFLYPLVVWAGMQVVMIHQGWTEGASWRLDVQAPAEVSAVLLEGNEAVGGGVEALRRGDLDAVVVVAEEGAALRATVEHLGVRTRSVAAADQVEQRLGRIRDDRVERFRADAGLGPPLRVRTVLDGDRGRVFDLVAALLLGLMVPMASAIAGLYPAVDLIAGERERQTVETTLVSPVPRGGLLLGRLATVTTLILASAALNAVGLSLTLSQAARAVTDPPTLWLPSLALLAALPAVVAGSARTAAIYLLTLLPARTFKEGEYLGSFVLWAVLGPPFLALSGLMSADPPSWQPWIPGTNVAWVVGRAAVGDLLAWEVVASCIVDLALTAAVFALASRVATSEGFLFGQQLPPWLGWVRRWMPA
ncbi:MAG: ABC transporter permease [Alphaproteobacteria bacterium]|nr:ABC transporter permease [Alphaproteobacteria bacterium]